MKDRKEYHQKNGNAPDAMGENAVGFVGTRQLFAAFFDMYL